MIVNTIKKFQTETIFMTHKMVKTFNLPFIVFFFAFAGQFIRNLLGWGTFFALVVVLLTIVILAYHKNVTRHTLKNTPFPLMLFIGWCALSLLWAQYPTIHILGIELQTTVMIGVVTQLVTAVVALLTAISVNLNTLLNSLSNALKWILGLSIVFEIFVSIFIRTPTYSLSQPKTPWSEGALLTGGPIQGIVGNRNLLAFIALIILITAIIEYFEHLTSIKQTVLWLTLSVVTLFLTQSATITLAVLTLTIFTMFILFVRKISPKKHKAVYYLTTTTVLFAFTFMVIFSSTIFSFLGRDPTASGRTGIWRSVIELIHENPVKGYGWMGYWNPTATPFNSLAVIDGVTYLQAHNAILDIIVQTGFIGMTFALMLAIIGSIRAWRFAIHSSDNTLHKFTPITMLPILLLAALFIQSLTESRILIEGNFLLLIIICYKVKELNPHKKLV